MRKIGTALIASVLSLAMAPAFAQDNDRLPLLTTNGNVMVSNRGEFVTAINGQRVVPGESIMVEAGSSAMIKYDEDCTIRYVHPGTYRVEEVCDRALAYIPPGNAGLMTGNVGAIGIVAGVVALSAAALHAMGDDSDPVPPLSP